MSKSNQSIHGFGIPTVTETFNFVLGWVSVIVVGACTLLHFPQSVLDDHTVLFPLGLTSRKKVVSRQPTGSILDCPIGGKALKSC